MMYLIFGTVKSFDKIFATRLAVADSHKINLASTARRRNAVAVMLPIDDIIVPILPVTMRNELLRNVTI